MIRIASIVAVLAGLVISTASAFAGSHSLQRRAVGRGIFITVDELHMEPLRAVDSLLEARVTVSNQGAMRIKLDYLTFSLSDAATGARSMALLPSELGGRAAPPLFLREVVVAPGQTERVVLYFRPLRPTSRPIDLRLDLATVDGQLISRSYLPLAF